MDINKKLAAEFGIREKQVNDTVALIDEGNTIPFIARYRKEATGGLTDEILRDLNDRLTYLRGLEERKEEVIRLIDEQGKLTEELKADIEKAEVLQRVEDLYKPYKQKRATRASKAKERGLEPLAMKIYAQQDMEGDPLEIASEYVNPEKEVDTPEEALQGALDIIAEMIADDPEIVASVREKTQTHGVIVTEASDKEEKTVYDLPYVVIFTTNEGSDIDKAMGSAFGSHYIRNEGYASEMTDRTYKKLAQQVYENLDGQGCFDSVKEKIALALQEAEGL